MPQNLLIVEELPFQRRKNFFKVFPGHAHWKEDTYDNKELFHSNAY